MNVFAERRNIMDNSFTPPVSIEKFAAYLDGNLPESQMYEMDMLVATNPVMDELVEMSDIIAEDARFYMNDGFASDAEMAMLDEMDFEIPALDVGMEPVSDAVDVNDDADVEMLGLMSDADYNSGEVFPENFININNEENHVSDFSGSQCQIESPIDDNLEPDTGFLTSSDDFFDIQ